MRCYQLRVFTRFLSSAKPKVYTRTGDGGSSSLFNGQRRNKDTLVFAALGDTDELNSHLGVVRSHCNAQKLAFPALEIFPGQFDVIQSLLIDVGAAIATPLSSSNEAQLHRAAFDEDGKDVQCLEAWIDKMEEELPPLRMFVLPSGGIVSSSLHVARTTCRCSAMRAPCRLSIDQCVSHPQT